MANPAFHSSIEGAQHGPKGLDDFLAFAKDSGAAGAQPSNYMLEASEDGTSFKTAQEIRDAFEKNGLKLDGISAHCPFGCTPVPGLEPSRGIHLFTARIKIYLRTSWRFGMKHTALN